MDDIAMDVDLDIDLGGGPDEDVIETESMAIEEAQENMVNTEVGTASTDLAPEKVHIRGLDNLTTEDIKAFAAEHYGATDIARVEWIDDTSANIVYASPEVAAQAILHFAQDTLTSLESVSMTPLELRQAKTLSSHPNTPLQMRIALASDVKAPRAREASRFYLLNPDKDPGERRGRNNNLRKGQRGPKRRRDEEDEVPFDVNMYDDDAGSLSARIDRPLGAGRSSRRLSDNAFDRNHRIQGKRARTGTISGARGDLFSDRLTSLEDRDRSELSRLRDRSASPLRVQGEDGRYGFSEEASGAIQGNVTPASRSSRDLFANGTSGRAGILQEKELFPNRSSPMRELFPEHRGPNGTPSSIHRRTDAFDANDGTPEHMSRSPLVKGRSLADRISKPGTGTSLEDRITRPGQGLESRISAGSGLTAGGEGFSIRGSGTADQNGPGFSIKGGAEKINPRVRELFPDKADNSGKELFARVAPRRRAGDLFS